MSDFCDCGEDREFGNDVTCEFYECFARLCTNCAVRGTGEYAGGLFCSEHWAQILREKKIEGRRSRSAARERGGGE